MLVYIRSITFEHVLRAAPWVVMAILVTVVLIQRSWLTEEGRPLVSLLGLSPTQHAHLRPRLILVMQPQDCASAVVALDPIDAQLSTVVGVEATFVGNDLSATEAASVASASGLHAIVHVIGQRDAVSVMRALSIRATPFAILVDTVGRFRHVFLPPDPVSIEAVRRSL